MNKQEQQVCALALEALIWASGAPSFGAGGEAEKGWAKISKPAIEQLENLLKEKSA